MAKSQKRSNKEVKKPKAVKPKGTADAPTLMDRALGMQPSKKRPKG